MANGHDIHVFELLLGVLIVSAMLLRTWLERLGVPSLAGFILLGFLVRALDNQVPFLSVHSQHVLQFLANTGIFILLFRVGLDSNLHGLIGKLPRAAPIWVGDILLSALPVYALCHWLFGLGVVPSMFAAVAMTATSIPVSAEVWREAGALKSSDGETLVDVAELDDLSGVALMVLAIAAAPALLADDGIPMLSLAGEVVLIFAAKAALFGGLCLLLARYGEKAIVARLRRTGAPGSALVLIGVGLIIATIAALLGFSTAIGAFFAGLIFSRDPAAVRMETSFMPLHAFFTPFFFISIGYLVDPQSLTLALGLGGGLLVVGVLGKILGNALPALLSTSFAGAALIGISMVPRAEVTMVIGQQAQQLGDWAMPPEVFSAIALASLVTCVLTPIAIRPLLRRRHRKK